MCGKVGQPDSVQQPRAGRANLCHPTCVIAGLVAHRSFVMATLCLGRECLRCRLRSGGFHQRSHGQSSRHPRNGANSFPLHRSLIRSAPLVARSARALPERAAAWSNPLTPSTRLARPPVPVFSALSLSGPPGTEFSFRHDSEGSETRVFRSGGIPAPSVICQLSLEINNRLNILQRS